MDFLEVAGIGLKRRDGRHAAPQVALQASELSVESCPSFPGQVEVRLQETLSAKVTEGRQKIRASGAAN